MIYRIHITTSGSLQSHPSHGRNPRKSSARRGWEFFNTLDPMTDPAGAGRKMLTWLGYIDGIHGTPYIAAPWILWGYGSVYIAILFCWTLVSLSYLAKGYGSKLGTYSMCPRFLSGLVSSHLSLVVNSFHPKQCMLQARQFWVSRRSRAELTRNQQCLCILWVAV